MNRRLFIRNIPASAKVEKCQRYTLASNHRVYGTITKTMNKLRPSPYRSAFPLVAMLTALAATAFADVGVPYHVLRTVACRSRYTIGTDNSFAPC